MPTRPVSAPVRPAVGHVALVAAGGAVGTVLRVALATWFPTRPGAYPWTTFLENVVGAFLLALVLAALVERAAADPRLRLLVGVGLLGSFTTYSTLAVEMERLIAGGHPGMSALYGIASVLVGLATAVVGLRLGRHLVRRRRPGGRAR